MSISGQDGAALETVFLGNSTEPQISTEYLDNLVQAYQRGYGLTVHIQPAIDLARTNTRDGIAFNESGPMKTGSFSVWAEVSDKAKEYFHSGIHSRHLYTAKRNPKPDGDTRPKNVVRITRSSTLEV
jgi:hypothetical protein